jgi:hypothetical protein
MEMLRFSVFSFALLALGCDGGSSVVPTGPSPSAPPASTPGPSRALVLPPNAASIAVGEVVKGQVTGEDPLCDPGWPHRCRYYRLVAPAHGTLNVTIKWSAQQVDPYPLDLDVINASLRIGSAPAIGPGPQRRTSVRVKAGDAYAIEVWSFLSPGEVFELSTTLQGS